MGTTMPMLPGYRIYNYLGAGAFGEVWLAQDLLAATFFRLVTGRAPFRSESIAVLKAEIRGGLPDPDPRCATLPEPLERIIRAGLAGIRTGGLA